MSWQCRASAGRVAPSERDAGRKTADGGADAGGNHAECCHGIAGALCVDEEWDEIGEGLSAGQWEIGDCMGQWGVSTANRPRKTRTWMTQKPPPAFSLSSERGVRGFAAQNFSIIRKTAVEETQAIPKLIVSGCVHGSLSPPRSIRRMKVETARMKAKMPEKSIWRTAARPSLRSCSGASVLGLKLVGRVKEMNMAQHTLTGHCERNDLILISRYQS